MRQLAQRGYSASQVEAMLRAPHAKYSARFELLNQSFSVVGTLDNALPGAVPSSAYTPGTITAATVETDTTRKLMGSLDLTMLPDSRLRNAPFQYRIKPYFQVGPMPDGGIVEFSMGVYPWNVPERSIAPGIEEWSITLADGWYDCDTSGPGPSGFQVFQTERQVEALKRLFNLAGFTDVSQVQDTGAFFQGPRSWGLTRPLPGWGFYYEPNWQQGWGFYYDPGNPGTISVGGQNPNQTRTTTLLDIIQEINSGIGNIAFMDSDGRPVVKPTVDWTKAGAAVTFGTGNDSITISPLQESTDMSNFCNRVFVWQEAGDAAIFYVTLDANDVVPNHPLAQANIKRYADRFISNSTADSQGAAQWQALLELLNGLSMHQRVEFQTLAWPVLEPYDIIGAMVAGDAEFGSQQLFQSVKTRFDLLTGEMSHEANRVFRV